MNEPSDHSELVCKVRGQLLSSLKHELSCMYEFCHEWERVHDTKVSDLRKIELMGSILEKLDDAVTEGNKELESIESICVVQCLDESCQHKHQDDLRLIHLIFGANKYDLYFAKALCSYLCFCEKDTHRLSILLSRMGDIYKHLEQERFSKKYYKLSIEMDDSNARAHARYAELLRDAFGKNKSALKWIKKAYEIDENDAWISQVYAKTLWTFDDKTSYQQSVKLLKHAHDLSKNTAVFAWDLCEAYLQLGKVEKAMKYAAKSYRLHEIAVHNDCNHDALSSWTRRQLKNRISAYVTHVLLNHENSNNNHKNEQDVLKFLQCIADNSCDCNTTTININIEKVWDAIMSAINQDENIDGNCQEFMQFEVKYIKQHKNGSCNDFGYVSDSTVASNSCNSCDTMVSNETNDSCDTKETKCVDDGIGEIDDCTVELGKRHHFETNLMQRPKKRQKLCKDIKTIADAFQCK